MLQKEFEERTGLKVTAEEYNQIDAMYMAAGDINKDDFCQEWKDMHLSDSRVLAEVFKSLQFAQNGVNKKMANELMKRGLIWNEKSGEIEEVGYKAIKTFEDAMVATGMTIDINEDDVPVDVLAMMKLRIICAALNGLGEADVDAKVWPEFTTDEERWYPYLILYTQEEIDGMDEERRKNLQLLLWGGSACHGASCGLACVYSINVFSHSDASFGARLALKSEELADYAGKQFTELWAQFYLGRDDFRRDDVK